MNREDVERCLFCDSPATAFCDATIALVDGGVCRVAGRAPYRVTTMEAMLSCSTSCDAPCCGRHRHVVGHVCGKDPDTLDRCHGCFGVDKGPRGLMTESQIVAVRRSMHARYRRMRVRIVPEGGGDGG